MARSDFDGHSLPEHRTSNGPEARGIDDLSRDIQAVVQLPKETTERMTTSAQTSVRLETHAHSHAPNRSAVIPTPRRLGASPDLAGRGVTIAVMDSGFFRHPDLTEPSDRIVSFVDVTGAETAPCATDGQAWHWHGTQTSVVAAGNGRLSGGVYCGLASAAHIALIKVSDRGRIRDEDIANGLRWVLENREKFNIRVVNMSLGGDENVSYRQSEIDQLAEQVVAAGVVVVVAAGNAGCSDAHTPIPPANAPSVITVGGYNDGNRLQSGAPGMYCSSFGRTVDGLLKPEIIAPAIWVAAPVLPGTENYTRAVALSEIDSTPDALLADLSATVWAQAGVGPFDGENVDAVRDAVRAELVGNKIVAAHYQHVDGTSFAAPIVASLVAQMLEANPTLTPAAIKSILLSTADRVPGVPAERQGYGTINARRAIDLASRERHALTPSDVRPPYCDASVLVFRCHDDAARTVALAGDFNAWSATAMAKGADGLWRVEIPTPAPGRYRYKFVVDGDRWIEDPANERREDDGLGGFHSIVSIG